MIRKFRGKDLPEVINILTESFKINLEVCNKMLAMIDAEENMFVLEEDGVVVTVASAIPFSVGDKKGRYIYAVATKSISRGKGYATNLLKYIIQYYNCDDVILLKPAEDSLFEFYKKVGFDTSINVSVTEYYPKLLIGKPSECDVEEYLNIRSKYNTFTFDRKVVDYYIDEYGYKSVRAFDTIALYRIENDICFIDEIYGKHRERLIYRIIKSEKAEKAMVTTEGNQPFALAYFYNEPFDVEFRIPME